MKKNYRLKKKISAVILDKYARGNFSLVLGFEIQIASSAYCVEIRFFFHFLILFISVFISFFISWLVGLPP